jgi:hypothetical protein
MAGSILKDAIALHASGRSKVAEAIYSSLLEQQPDQPAVLIGLARCATQAANCR